MFLFRRIQGCFVSWWTPTRTCPFTQNPLWRCTGAKNGTRCPHTSTLYQRLPIGACCKVINYLWPPTPDQPWHCSKTAHLLSARLVLLNLCDLWSLNHATTNGIWRCGMCLTLLLKVGFHNVNSQVWHCFQWYHGISVVGMIVTTYNSSINKTDHFRPCLLSSWDESKRIPSNSLKAVKGWLSNSSASGCFPGITGHERCKSVSMYFSHRHHPFRAGCRCGTAVIEPVGPVWIFSRLNAWES